MKLAKFSAKLAANFRRNLEGDFRASFAGENCQKHFPPRLHRKLHHQTSLRGSGLWRALQTVLSLPHKRGFFFLFQNDPRGEGNCETMLRGLRPKGPGHLTTNIVQVFLRNKRIAKPRFGAVGVQRGTRARGACS